MFKKPDSSSADQLLSCLADRYLSHGIFIPKKTGASGARGEPSAAGCDRDGLARGLGAYRGAA